MTEDTERKEADAVGGSPLQAVVMRDLKPMSEAPRDGTEILAYHKEGGNFHPIMWKDWKWKEGNYPRWGMRWNEEYSTQDGFYSGWIPYPVLGA